MTLSVTMGQYQHEALSSEMSSRDRVNTQIHAAVLKGQHLMLSGPVGMGKSRLLGQLAAKHGRAFFVRGIGAKKAILLSMCQRLHAHGQLGGEYELLFDFEDARKKLNRLTVPQLMEVILEGAGSGGLRPERAEGWLLAVDRAEIITERSMKDIILPLANVCTLILAVDEPLTPSRERNLQLVADKCQVFELPPLTDSEIRELLWRTLDRSKYRHWQVIEAKVVNTAQGRPGAAIDLAKKLATSTGSLQEIRALEHSAFQASRISLLIPGLILIITAVMVSRYLARGLDDPAFYLLASMSYVFVIFLRPFLFRRMRT